MNRSAVNRRAWRRNADVGWHSRPHLPMTTEEVDFFRTVAERDPPEKPVCEVWVIAGRRAGKDSVASLIAAYAAAFFNHSDRLRPGERPLVLNLATAADRLSAIVLISEPLAAARSIRPLWHAS
jgi:hypothetical protein